MVGPILESLLDDPDVRNVESDSRLRVYPLENILPLEDISTQDIFRKPSDVPEGWCLFYEAEADRWYLDRYTFIRGLEERTITLSSFLTEEELPAPIYGLFWQRDNTGRWKQQIEPWYRDSFLPRKPPAWVLGGSALSSPHQALPFTARLPRVEPQQDADPIFDKHTAYIVSSMKEEELPPPMEGYIWDIRALNIQGGMWVQVESGGV
jgi:hypothetical protein